jgi:glycosyltransferase involved in cell wall biosynthesis
MRAHRSAASVLIIVQNLPVPLDRRVWLECQALVRAGFTVSVICPKGPGDPSYEFLDGVHLYKYRPAPATRGIASYLWEFGYSWVRTALLSVRVRRRHGFTAMQACNPPDTYWLLARLWRLAGVRFLYDQHDLNPEVFRSRFGEPHGRLARLQYRSLLWLERSTYRAAHEVVSTNESYRSIAMSRGGCDPRHVTVVRSGPDTEVMRPRAAEPQLRKGRRHLLVYLGIMGPQDGVDMALRALDVLVHEFGVTDVHLALLGFGDSFDELVALSEQLRLGDHVTFTGRADQEMIARYLSTASIGICPDPLNPLNDVSTMNKVMEYMAFALPVVGFDLTETRVSAGETGVYVDPATGAKGLASALVDLLEDEPRRRVLAAAARERAVRYLDWRPQAARYVEAWCRLLGLPAMDGGRERLPEAPVGVGGPAGRLAELLPVQPGSPAADALERLLPQP